VIAALEAYQAGLLARSHWARNMLSGLVVGVVALPLAMAFAIASGARPEQGIYTAIIAGAMVSVFGGSRVQIAGPTGAFVVILSGITARYGIDGLQIATLMAGVMLLLLGAARMGGVIKFIPDPVIVGFTAGIAVIIWVGQWKYFFGLPTIEGTRFHQQLWHQLQLLPKLNVNTTMVAALSLLAVLVTPRLTLFKRLPGPLVAVIASCAAQSIWHFEGIATIGSAFGGIPPGLPSLHWPALSADRALELISPAFAIAMLGAIESLLSAVVADGMAGTRHDPDQELIGQGLANMVTPLFGGFAATGAIARTATNVRSGGNSPLAGIVHGLTLLLIVLLLAPLAANLPLATLAAILFVVAWNMSEARHFVRMVVRAPRADVGILLVTFILTVFVDLVAAVYIGVILATLQFLRRMSASVEVKLATEQDLRSDLTQQGMTTLPRGVLVYSIEGPFFFGAVENFERALAGTHTDPKVLIIRLQRVPFIDITGLQTLEEVIRDLQRRHVRVLLCGANERVHAKLEKAGTIELLGNGRYHSDFGAALQSATILAATAARTASD
jgi:SulP family sulfate permease